IGLPGRSNAFAIAERLGLSSSIVGPARALVSSDDLTTESLLGEIQQAHREATAARDEVLLIQRRIAEQERQLASRLAVIEAERASILGEARAEARRELSAVREEIEALRSNLSESQSQATLGEEWLAQAQARLTEMEEQVLPAPPPLQPEPRALSGEIEAGDTVWLRGLNTTGQVVALEGDTAEVQVGSFGVRVERGELERRAPAEAAEPERAAVQVRAQAAPNVELDLRGQRIEEALPQVDKYLDDAFLAGMPFVRIVHGKGTGALRQAVRQQLRGHPLVNSFRAGEQGEGGTGVTVAYLIEA
ncbi:MAG: Smr/MutS family protein, partial [Anaerolineae bacterium]